MTRRSWGAGHGGGSGGSGGSRHHERGPRPGLRPRHEARPVVVVTGVRPGGVHHVGQVRLRRVAV